MARTDPRPQMRRVVVRRLADYPPPTPLETPCRLWQGRTRGQPGRPYPHNIGYGLRPDGQMVHRWVWEQINGPVPEGMLVLHRCDHPLCYRYDHLFLGTPGDNMHDMDAKGRRRSVSRPRRGEQHYNAKLTDAQVAAIRADPRSSNAVAEDYPVSARTIRKIRQGVART